MIKGHSNVKGDNLVSIKKYVRIWLILHKRGITSQKDQSKFYSLGHSLNKIILKDKSQEDTSESSVHLR